MRKTGDNENTSRVEAWALTISKYSSYGLGWTEGNSTPNTHTHNDTRGDFHRLHPTQGPFWSVLRPTVCPTGAGRKIHMYSPATQTQWHTHTWWLRCLVTAHTAIQTSTFQLREAEPAGKLGGWGGGERFEVSTLCLGFNLILKSF